MSDSEGVLVIISFCQRSLRWVWQGLMKILGMDGGAHDLAPLHCIIYQRS